MHVCDERCLLPSGACAIVIASAFPDGVPLEDVGRELGLTRERVRQLEERALRKARQALARRGVR